jgi:hypothetical protein
MIEWSRIAPVAESDPVDLIGFRERIEPLGRPVLLRALVAHWPAVEAARRSDLALCDYLRRYASGTPAEACFGHAEMRGRFFYNADFSGFNFERRSVAVGDLLDFLLQVREQPEPLYGYAGAVRMRESLPGLLEDNPSPLLDSAVEQLNSIWIGNRTRISAHWDLPRNLICAIGGRRRYVLFPPDQIGNLYPGPIDFTPAGQPISLVDFHAPDWQRFPRFAAALEQAQIAVLAPGDALYLPSLWWHHAESLDPLGVMINYWWRESPTHHGAPRATLMHALMTLRELPLEERLAWRTFFDHYVFRPDGADPLAHIPPQALGVLGAMTPEHAARLRAQLVRALQW